MLIRIRHIILFISILTVSTHYLYAQDTLINPNNDIRNRIGSSDFDKTSIKNNAFVQNDSIQIDSIPLKKKKESLKDIVEHSSYEKITIRVKDQTTTLYDKAKLHYEDVNLEAGIIIIDYKNDIIIAKGIQDSLGYTQKPYFKQGSEESTQDSLIVNYKSFSALIWLYFLYSFFVLIII